MVYNGFQYRAFFLRAIASPFGASVWIRKRHPLLKMLYFHMSENCDNIISLNKTLYHICRKNHHNKCQTYTAYDVNYIPRGVVPLCKAQQHGYAWKPFLSPASLSALSIRKPSPKALESYRNYKTAFSKIIHDILTAKLKSKAHWGPWKI